MQDDTLAMRLQNGRATITKFMVSTNIIYNKEVLLKGMSGPKTTMIRTEVDENGFRNTMVAINPSPLEIDLGTVRQEIRNGKGEKIAEQKGEVYFTRGKSTYIMEGVTMGVATEGAAVVVGVGVEEENFWTNQTIVHFKALLKLTEEFVVLCHVSENNEV